MNPRLEGLRVREKRERGETQNREIGGFMNKDWKFGESGSNGK